MSRDESCPQQEGWWEKQWENPALIALLSSLSLLFSLTPSLLPDCFPSVPPHSYFSGSFQMTKFLFPKRLISQESFLQTPSFPS